MPAKPTNSPRLNNIKGLFFCSLSYLLLCVLLRKLHCCRSTFSDTENTFGHSVAVPSPAQFSSVHSTSAHYGYCAITGLAVVVALSCTAEPGMRLYGLLVGVDQKSIQDWPLLATNPQEFWTRCESILVGECKVSRLTEVTLYREHGYTRYVSEHIQARCNIAKLSIEPEEEGRSRIASAYCQPATAVQYASSKRRVRCVRLLS